MRYPFLWIWNIKVKFFISLSSAKGKGSAMSAFCINIYHDTIRFTYWYCNWPILAFWLHVLIPVKSRYLPLWLVLWHYGWWICLCRQETLLVPKNYQRIQLMKKLQEHKKNIIVFTLSTLTSICIFSILFSKHSLRCWWGELVS